MYGKHDLSSLKSHVRNLWVNSKQRKSNIKINTWTNNTSILNQESSGDSKAERVKKEAALLCSSGLCILVTDVDSGQTLHSVYVLSFLYVFSVHEGLLFTSVLDVSYLKFSFENDSRLMM